MSATNLSGIIENDSASSIIPLCLDLHNVCAVLVSSNAHYSLVSAEIRGRKRETDTGAFEGVYFAKTSPTDLHVTIYSTELLRGQVDKLLVSIRYRCLGMCVLIFLGTKYLTRFYAAWAWPASETDRCRTCVVGTGPGGAMFNCSCCKRARYCSVTCQKADWKRHRNSDCGTVIAQTYFVR